MSDENQRCELAPDLQTARQSRRKTLGLNLVFVKRFSELQHSLCWDVPLHLSVTAPCFQLCLGSWDGVMEPTYGVRKAWRRHREGKNRLTCKDLR